FETPEADSLNPAVSGANQRSVLDLSYIGITGFNAPAGNGWLGHAANIGVSFPTSAGVFSGSLHLLSSFLPAMQLGNNLGARFSFSKDLYPYLLVGAGLSLDVGGLTTTDFGASVDLGALMLPGTIGPLQDFRWGIALRNIGRSYTPVTGYSAIPAPFTPAIGAAFNAVKTQNLTISLNSDLSFPSFQDVRLALGGTVSLFNTVSLNAGWQADLHSLIDSAAPQRSLLPTFGVSVIFKTDFKGKSGIIAENGWNQSEVHTHFAAAPLYGGDWGFGGGINALLGVIDNTPPAVTIDYPKKLYISPNNDGTQDALDLPISITDQRYVMGYDLKIIDAAGNVVRNIRNKDSRPENRGFRNVVDRLLAVKRGIDIPKTLRWDGTSDSGSTVKDGEYGFSLEAWDDNGNVGRTPVYHVIVDDTPPSVSITVPAPADTIFSPNGDGNKDTFTIRQSGSSELLWTADIRNSTGKTVLSHTWTGKPTDFTWDGRATDGRTVPDGVYDYMITSTDLAGNRGSAVLDNIIVNTQATPIKLTIDNRYFSPNGDGVKDNVTFTPEVPVRSGIDSWKLDIIDANGSTVREMGGNGVPPDHIVFNGMGANGVVLPEESYHAKLTLNYQNGNQPNDTSPPFTLQLTPPNAAITDNYSVFSPNGDGNKDTITFFQETSPATEWTGTVRSAAGKVMKTFTWPGTADLQTVWDGRGNDGSLVPDGEYTYQLSGSDAAGNKGSSNTLTFSINTEATPVLLSAQYEAFSPNSDGVKDTIQLIPRLKKNDGITAYTLSILDSAGKSVRAMMGNGTIAGPFTWDGQNNAGIRAPDGTYTAQLSVQYVNGNQELARTAPFILDTVYPSAALSADYTLFSPDGDGHRDTVTIHQTTSNETLWQGRIVNEKGQEVRTVYWKGLAGDLIWDGTDDAGNRVPDGTYRYTLSAEDRAGNRTEKSMDLQVDTRPASVFVTV
ncbi:MAG TPA: FlgD immunoglobulin-like domain containing protein, partial [Spirochaetia bacterium]|nr:FlgD immunoglobulin-like domain containing protein [Spirochaetia bacterium]